MLFVSDAFRCLLSQMVPVLSLVCFLFLYFCFLCFIFRYNILYIIFLLPKYSKTTAAELLRFSVCFFVLFIGGLFFIGNLFCFLLGVFLFFLVFLDSWLVASVASMASMAFGIIGFFVFGFLVS